MAQNEEEISKSLTILAKGSIIVFIGIFFSKFLTYAYRVIIARGFGPESYGLFSLALIIATLFSTVASLGLSEGILRYASLYNNVNDLKKLKPLLKFSLIFSFISGVVFALILFIFSDLIATNIFHNTSLSIYLVYFSIGIPFILISNLFLSIIKANQQILRYTFTVNILQNLVRFVIIFFLIIIGLKSYAIIGSYLVGILAMSLGAYIFARKYVLNIFGQKNIGSKESKILKSAFISYSWPIIFAGFIGTILYWIDSIVIGYLLDTTSVGIYSAAFTVASILGIAPELFMQIFLPVILQEYAKGRTEVIKQTSKQVSKWIGLLNLPAFTLMFLFPDIIIELLFGSQYLDAADSLRVLAVGGFFSSFISLNTNLLSMKGKSKSILLTLVISSTVNLLLSFFLVSSYGLIGAAFTTSLVWFLTWIVFSVQVYASTGIIAVRKELVRLSFLSLVLALILAFLGSIFGNTLQGSLIGVIIYFILYLVVVVISKSLDQNDIFLIRKVLIAVKSRNFKSLSQRAE